MPVSSFFWFSSLGTFTPESDLAPKLNAPTLATDLGFSVESLFSLDPKLKAEDESGLMGSELTAAEEVELAAFIPKANAGAGAAAPSPSLTAEDPRLNSDPDPEPPPAAAPNLKLELSEGAGAAAGDALNAEKSALGEVAVAAARGATADTGTDAGLVSGDAAEAEEVLAPKAKLPIAAAGAGAAGDLAPNMGALLELLDPNDPNTGAAAALSSGLVSNFPNPELGAAAAAPKENADVAGLLSAWGTEPKLNAGGAAAPPPAPPPESAPPPKLIAGFNPDPPPAGAAAAAPKLNNPGLGFSGAESELDFARKLKAEEASVLAAEENPPKLPKALFFSPGA